MARPRERASGECADGKWVLNSKLTGRMQPGCPGAKAFDIAEHSICFSPLLPMKSFRSLYCLLLLAAPGLFAQDPAPAAAPAGAAGAAPAAPRREVTDVLEKFVNWLHHFFPGVDDALFHWIACLIIIVLAILLRHVATNVIFHYLKKMAEKTETTLDDKLFPAMESPVATLIMVLGIFGALTALQLSETSDRILNNAATIAILGVIIWGLIRAGGAVLDHFEEIAHEKKMTVATFMPLIKKTLLVFAIVCGVLFIADSLGAKVGTFLATLGIGGLAFALAAQDTIANLFGSFVVVVDQPFKVGDAVRIGSSEGIVEDIGLRSTKIRTAARNLIVLPNKTVASEVVVNNSRFIGRRVEQVLGLTYDVSADDMEKIVNEIRRIIMAHAEVDPASVLVYFRDFSASSLDIWLAYNLKDPDFAKHMALRQTINFEIMRAIDKLGHSFAFPTQTMHLPDPIVQKLAAASEPAKK